MTTHDYLLTTYGPLLTYCQLAQILSRSDGGLRNAIYRGRNAETEYAKLLRGARTRVGRQVYFRAADIAGFIDAGALPQVREP